MQGEKMEDQDLLLLVENVEMKNSRDTKDTYSIILKLINGIRRSI